jgi:hypothetical protein
MGEALLYVDGLLEGHETKRSRVLYRMFMGSFILFSVFSGICNIALIGHKGFHPSHAILSICILMLLAFTLMFVKWYRHDTLDPKFRKATGALMFITICLGIAASMQFHTTLTMESPAAAEVPPPTTVAPTAAPTPAPTSAGPPKTIPPPAGPPTIPGAPTGPPPKTIPAV